MDNGIFSFDEIEIEDDIIFDPDRAAWDRLIDQIIRGNVIPVIAVSYTHLRAHET